ncbi:putative membrane protein [Proteiniphilum saccharofermentans]|uniref:Putative membrane protein n=1 Tax=Proteiniphilum saccharofermentans TaxID=1642647 RepID=A0A1R3T3G6_9BACT|nr:putative membrane protein [Proteiniphilum saccharofermentans]
MILEKELETKIFQFYLVRLMDRYMSGRCEQPKKFQFYLVRLMASPFCVTRTFITISILPSTINGFRAYFYHGGIFAFQFYLVRLMVTLNR